MPESIVKINRKCELVANICHNVTRFSKPITSNTLIFQGSMKIFNSSSDARCKVLKTNQNKDLIRLMMTINGVRTCDHFKLGIQCSNGTIMKFQGSEKTIKLIAMTTRQNEKFRLVDTIYFEKGRTCVNATFIVKKY